MTISDPQKTILTLLAHQAMTRGVIANRAKIPIMGVESSLRTLLAKGMVRRKKNPAGPDPWLYEVKA